MKPRKKIQGGFHRVHRLVQGEKDHVAELPAYASDHLSSVAGIDDRRAQAARQSAGCSLPIVAESVPCGTDQRRARGAEQREKAGFPQAGRLMA